MKQILYIIGFLRKPLVQAPGNEADRIGDPLSHPVIRAMNREELADLPFGTALHRDM